MRCLTSAVALVIFCLASAVRGETQGNAEKGRQLFLRDRCYTCHGTQGAGGGMVAPPLSPDPVPFEAMLMQLRNPASRMPIYTEKVLSDAEAADIYAYLKSIPPGPPAARIPLLNLSGMSAKEPSASDARHTHRAALHAMR